MTHLQSPPPQKKNKFENPNTPTPNQKNPTQPYKLVIHVACTDTKKSIKEKIFFLFFFVLVLLCKDIILIYLCNRSNIDHLWLTPFLQTFNALERWFYWFLWYTCSTGIIIKTFIMKQFVETLKEQKPYEGSWVSRSRERKKILMIVKSLLNSDQQFVC